MTNIRPMTPPGTKHLTLAAIPTTCRRCGRRTAEYATVEVFEANATTFCLDCWSAWGQLAILALKDAMTSFMPALAPQDGDGADDPGGEDQAAAATPAP